MLPFVYLSGSNFYSLYAVGFKFFPVLKGSFWGLTAMIFRNFYKNLMSNSSATVFSMYLLKDGKNLKMNMGDGRTLNAPINTLNAITKD